MRRSCEDPARPRRCRPLVAAALLACVSFSSCGEQKAPAPGAAPALVPASAAPAQAARSKPVLTIQRQVSLMAPVDVPYTARPLQDAAFAARPRAEPQPAGVSRFLGSAAQNARQPVPLREGAWALRWSQPLKVDGAPAPILELREHIVVQAGDWVLFGADGTRIASGAMGRSALTGDSAGGLFYLVDGAEQLQARAADSGALQFRWPVAMGEGFSYPLLTRAGARFLVAGIEHDLFGHPTLPATHGRLYLLDVGEVGTDESKMLRTAKRSETLRIGEPRMLVAMAGERSLLATRGRLTVVSGELQVEAVFETDDFEPQLLSADEAGYMHLVAGRGSARLLWVVSPAGLRVAQAELSPTLGPLGAPPVIGYDRRIFVWGSTRLQAYTPDAKPLWDWQCPEGIAGVGVSTNDQLLLACGSEVRAIDSAGKARTLFRFDGETIVGPPVLAANGDLLVATRTRLHRLGPR